MSPANKITEGLAGPDSKDPDGYLIRWPALYRGTLIKRYKRFLADVKLETGEAVTAHCANSGSMKACSEPGSTVYLTFHDNPKRKLKYTWELIEMPGSLVGVNTGVPNKLVKKAIEVGDIEELRGYDRVQPEVKTIEGTRLDLLLEKNSGEKCFVEIKNCTLVENGKASFPDAVTTRGRKHLVELMRLKKRGDRAVIFYLIQRMDADLFSPAEAIDPDYAEALREAHHKGVEILVYNSFIDSTGTGIDRKIPFKL
jgi:sugar fermentation stimulation protein A